MRRRQFLATTAACALVPSIGRLAVLAAGPVRPRIRAFAPSQVRLRPGPALDAAEVNRRFVLGQDVDRLLHNFRQNAGLPSSAAPLGGWEAPNNELRGHYVGHYLSACAPSLTGQAPWVRGEDGKPLTFRTTAGERRELVPLYQIMDERYSVYFKVPA